MVKKGRKFHTQRRLCAGPSLVGESIFGLLEAMGGSRERGRLADLWRAWPDVVGARLAAQIVSVAHKKGVLIIGVEDATQMQELHFQKEEILQKSNAFLGAAFFSDARLTLARRK